MKNYSELLYIFNKIDNISISLDIGGTLIKLIIFSKDPSKLQSLDLKYTLINLNTSEMYFYMFNKDDLFIKNFKKIISNPTITCYITGGGACKYENIIKNNTCSNEFDSLVLGFLKLLKMKNEIFTINGLKKQYTQENIDNKILLVNIGSGVSILKINIVDNNVIWKRISGTSLGGGTFINLCNLIEKNNINWDNYNLYVDKIIDGDNTEVDLLVKDIYGSHIKNISGTKLNKNTIASSFGKFNYFKNFNYLFLDLVKTLFAIIKLFISKFILLDKTINLITNLDIYQKILHKIIPKQKNIYTMNICNSFLKLIIYNISQIVYLNSELHDISKIYFVGNFINNDLIMKNIQTTIKYWDLSNKKKCLFMKHAGFLGCIGKIKI